MPPFTDTPECRDRVACPVCDTLHRAGPADNSGDAACTVCGQRLYSRSRHGVDGALAFALAALILFVPANIFPLVELSSHGLKDHNRLITGPLDLIDTGMPFVGGLVLLTSIIFPVLFLAAMAFVCLCAKLDCYPRDFGPGLRLCQALNPWAMVDVYILACLVAFVKLADLANLIPQTGLYCLAGALLLSLMATVNFDPDALWRRFSEKTKGHRL